MGLYMNRIKYRMRPIGKGQWDGFSPPYQTSSPLKRIKANNRSTKSCKKNTARFKAEKSGEGEGKVVVVTVREANVNQGGG